MNQFVSWSWRRVKVRVCDQADPSPCTTFAVALWSKDRRVARIVEERDASEGERRIREINTSIMVVRKSLLGPGLRLVGRQNAQNEYYLTDLIGVLYEGGHVTRSHRLSDVSEAAGVNDRAQLAVAEREMRRRINERWMRRGVTMWDPATTYIV
mgnify:CR=1 FL=1